MSKRFEELMQKKLHEVFGEDNFSMREIVLCYALVSCAAQIDWLDGRITALETEKPSP